MVMPRPGDLWYVVERCTGIEHTDVESPVIVWRSVVSSEAADTSCHFRIDNAGYRYV